MTSNSISSHYHGKTGCQSNCNMCRLPPNGTSLCVQCRRKAVARETLTRKDADAHGTCRKKVSTQESCEKNTHASLEIIESDTSDKVMDGIFGGVQQEVKMSVMICKEVMCKLGNLIMISNYIV